MSLKVSNDTQVETPKEEKRQIIWTKVILVIYLHYGAFLGMYYGLTTAKFWTQLWTFFIMMISSQGTGAGVHRLWAHRSYKARLPLKILLTIYQTITFQKDIYDWCRDHRMHHKFSDKEPDPHNASKGFFYSHMGWLMLRKSEVTKSKIHYLDLSDLEADPIVMFQRKYYWYLAFFWAGLFPAGVPWYFWNEDFAISWYLCNMFRFAFTMHCTCLVNSAAHIFGNRPYDKNLLPTQNLLVSFLTNGEGFHNYHHTFPYDYKAAELGSYYGNLSTAFIDFMYKIGWAYDLKSVPEELVRRRIQKTGDGSWRLNEQATWGWGDTDMDVEEINQVRENSRG